MRRSERQEKSLRARFAREEDLRRRGGQSEADFNRKDFMDELRPKKQQELLDRKAPGRGGDGVKAADPVVDKLGEIHTTLKERLGVNL
jgi:hypothetical protein